MDASEKWFLLEKAPMFLAAMYVSKYLASKCIFNPIGRRLGMDDKPPAPPPTNPSLEKVYESYGRQAVKNPELLSLVARRENLTRGEIKEWLMTRRKQDDGPELSKFAYECWVVSYYTVLFASSLYIMLRKQWFWDIENCWQGYPNHKPDVEMKIYFTTSFCYFLFDFFILLRTKYQRKDHVTVLIHHLSSAALMAASWHLNLFRFGSLILFLMELVGPALYLSRLGRRMKRPIVSDVSLVFFVVIWIACRVFLLHIWAIRSFLHFRYNSGLPFGDFLISDLLLFEVLCVNAWWTYVILNKFIKNLTFRNLRKTFKSLSTTLAKRGD